MDNQMQTVNPKLGEIWWADLPFVGDHVTFDRHPVLVLGNQKATLFSPTITVMVLSSNLNKLHSIPTHVLLQTDFLPKPSIVCPEQLLTINKRMLITKLGRICEPQMSLIWTALKGQLGIPA